MFDVAGLDPRVLAGSYYSITFLRIQVAVQEGVETTRLPISPKLHLVGACISCNSLTDDLGMDYDVTLLFNRPN